MFFDFTPDPKVLIALTHTPMQPLDALCEPIDNAIDSFSTAEIQGISIESPMIIIELPSRKQIENNTGILRIRDNGPGMTAENAEKAIKAGFSGNNPYDNLGLFGMGFNISTGKFGNVTTLITARGDSTKYIKTVINLENINKTKDYSLQAQEIEKSENQPFKQNTQGTIVEISDWWPEGNANKGFLNKLIQYGMPKIREEIGRRYATILRKRDIRIIINSEKCNAYEHCVWDESRFITRKSGKIPAMMHLDHVVGNTKRCGDCTALLGSSDSECPSCGSTKIRTIEERVHGWIGIQRYDSDTDFGIDLIRNGRAIKIAEKQALFEYVDEFKHVIKDYPIDQQYGRINGEIHLDFVPVDFLKQDFQRSSAEWQKSMSYLRGDSSLQPTKSLGTNDSPMYKLYQGFRRVRNFGKADIYMGYWDVVDHKAKRISRDIEEEYIQKFKDKQPGFYDDSEWWKLVESADQPPVEELIDCPECGAQNLKEADHCLACDAVLQGKECINIECHAIIPLSAVTCPSCGKNQIPVVVEPWLCQVCGTKNVATFSECVHCHMPKGSKDPLSEEVLLTVSDKDDSLSNEGLIIELADGTSSKPVRFDVYLTQRPMIPITLKQPIPVLIFKKIGCLAIFADKTHRLFKQCNIKIEQIIASEIAMYLYDERKNLANYLEHNLSNLTWEVINKNWIDSLELSPDSILNQTTDLLVEIRQKLKENIGIEAAYYFDELSIEQKKSVTDALITQNVDLSSIGTLKDNGGYLSYVPFDFLLALFDISTVSFFNGGVWNVPLNNGGGDLLGEDVVIKAQEKIKQQYRNNLEDVINFNRVKYTDSLTVRRVVLSVEFLRQRIDE